MPIIDTNMIDLFIFIVGLIAIFLMLLYSVLESEEEETEEE
ncbi:MAG: hypothetical protein ACTSP4_02910 [Candidatus Hodarchaeales archaeon]